MKRTIFLVLISFLIFNNTIYAASNPYGKYQNLYGITTVRCTWYAWQEAYENTGVALPGWGNAQTWYNSAINSGYEVGREARPNSIAVWSSSDGYGHVGFVVSVEGEYMTTNEGGIVTEENEGIVIGMKRSTNAGNLIGFIYLEEAPTKPNSNNNVSSNNENTSKNESSNNNLKSLDINIDGFEFKKDVLEYELAVDYATQIIKISAEAADKNAVVTGTGEKALKVGENNYSIMVTAEDKTTKEYKITIIRDKALANGQIETLTEEEPTDSKNYFMIGLIVASVLFFIMVILFIKKKKRVSKQK